MRILILVHLLTFFFLFLSKDQRTNAKNKNFKKALRFGNLLMKVNVSLIKNILPFAGKTPLWKRDIQPFFNFIFKTGIDVSQNFDPGKISVLAMDKLMQYFKKRPGVSH